MKNLASRAARDRCQGRASVSSDPAASWAPSGVLRPDLSQRLTLDNIRMALIRREDTIIFSLIERSQFRLNAEAYGRGAVSVPCYDPKTGDMKSLLELSSLRTIF